MKEFTKADIDAAIRSVSEINDELENERLWALVNELEKQDQMKPYHALMQSRRALSELCVRLGSMLSGFKDAPGTSEASKLHVVSTAQMIQSEGVLLQGHIEDMKEIADVSNAKPEKLSMIKKVITAGVSWVTKKLMPMIKNLLSKVWSIIVGLITPKEWKIKGTVGSKLLGLGSVELEITFGP